MTYCRQMPRKDEPGPDPSSLEIVSGERNERFDFVIASAEGPRILYDRYLAAVRARSELERLRSLQRG
jgi:hypothetical protein